MNFIKKFFNSKKIQKRIFKENYENQNLKKGWKYPEIPADFTSVIVSFSDGYYILPDFVAFDGNGRFIRMATDGLNGSDINPIVIEWPWVGEYNPTCKDWESIDIIPSRVLGGPEESMIKETKNQRWLSQLPAAKASGLVR